MLHTAGLLVGSLDLYVHRPNPTHSHTAQAHLMLNIIDSPRPDRSAH